MPVNQGRSTMQEYIDIAVEFISSAELYIIAITGVLVALAGVAKLTKNKTDDKLVGKAVGFMNKIKALLGKVKKNKV